MDFASHRHKSNIEHAVRQAISQVQVYPEIYSASRQLQSLNGHSDEDFSSGSDGGEIHSPTYFGASSSDREGGLHLESDELWK